MKKDSIIIARISRNLKEIISQVSAKNGLTLSAYLHRLIMKDLEEKNINKKLDRKK